ncbi:MAG: DUF3891 family protein [Thermomicrobiales bacterium]
MLHRREDSDLIVVTQPSHAWISGQLAAAWGNPELGLEQPDSELRIAAEQHDIAWLDWEASPTLNRETGLPYTFSQLPTIEHLEVWGNARRWAQSYGVLPALLISMHGTYLYDRFHNYDDDSTEEAREARSFLSREKKNQEHLYAKLQQQRDISQDSVAQQRKLISLWDALSLRLLMGIDEPEEFGSVPTAAEDIILTVRPQSPANADFGVDPWPFVSDSVTLACEGRVLQGTFDDEEAMRAALESAPTRFIGFRLVAS